MTKPFNPRELLARIGARLRRSQPPQSARQLRVGQLEMDLNRHIVTCAGNEIDLTPTEFDLLRTLMQNPGYVFARDELLENTINRFILQAITGAISGAFTGTIFVLIIDPESILYFEVGAIPNRLCNL